ncbi:MAG: amidohydrolase [Deltaproteobacteria bacterium HGW-Deltaproteobacteria-14]|nr:MAG: amidohydrolase [Deltaproteobacteria bacterium HGW-Deltaproteobacteria-14]
MNALRLSSLLGVALTAGAAQGAGPPSTAGPPCALIRGVTLSDGAGDRVVDVVVRGDRVAAVRILAGGEPEPGCDVIAGAGRVLTAGLVDPYTRLGLVEVDLEAPTVDTDLRAPFQDPSGQIRASVRADLAYNPRSSLIGVTRLEGVTSAISVPSGGVISGRSFWVDLVGARQGTAIQRAPVAMHASLGPRQESRASAFQTIDVALREARDFATRQREWAKNQTPGFLTPRLDLAALLPVAKGELPLVVTVDRASDIEGLLRMTAGTPLRLVIAGGAEAWLVRDALAQRKVAVILDPLTYGPGSFDQLAARPDNAALLHAAGVAVMFSTFSSHGARKLRQLAGNAVRGGLSHAAALDAVTRVPAEVFGLADHGRVAPGAIADLVLWSGDPFELSTRVEGLWIHGRSVPLTSRQTALRDRYRHVPPR